MDFVPFSLGSRGRLRKALLDHPPGAGRWPRHIFTWRVEVSFQLIPDSGSVQLSKVSVPL